MKDKELKELINHYNTFLGEVEQIQFTPDKQMPLKLDFVLSRATEFRPYNIVGTMGLSEIKLKGIYENCEIIMLLGEEWKFKLKNLNNNWPFELVNKIANAVYLSDTELGYGKYFINEDNKTFSPLTDMGVALIGIPAMLDRKFFELKSGKKKINFFLLITATFEELKLIKKIGGINFIQRYLLPEGESAFVIHNNTL